MKQKKLIIDNLSGKALDYAVAMLEYPGLVYGKTIGITECAHQLVIPDMEEPLCYFSPSSSWEIAGKIIEREKISIIYSYAHDSWGAVWHKEERPEKAVAVFGEDPLEAALRCYVQANTTGPTIKVPADLV